VTFDFEKVWASKRHYRQRLAALPITEKLALLDRLRERRLAIRRPHHPDQADALEED
jgi:hypothetical protein